jgi:hypothetical protein
MKGGAKESLIDIAKKYAAPLNVYLGIALVLAISYVGKIPDSTLRFLDSFLGRAVLFAGTLFVASLYSWVYAVLLGIFAVLVLSMAPRSTVENFRNAGADDEVGGLAALDKDVDVKLVSQKKRWWIEEVMGENPIGIEEEKVRTSAIQDNTNSSSSAGGR